MTTARHSRFDSGPHYFTSGTHTPWRDHRRVRGICRRLHMAGWIKWQKGLTRRSEVLQIAATVKQDRRRVACACMELWE